ncbi:MAG TPA: metalloprotease PmbA [Steroidobacteraceae bacterium]|nr:metalloprotease PmbA [Steroidobacteraceae bacterium]
MNTAPAVVAADDKSTLEAVVAQSLKLARARGASDAEVGASMQTGLSVTVRLGEVETLEYQRDRGVGVTVYFGKRKGSASTSDLSQAALADTVEKACSIAGFTAEDDCAGLPDEKQLALKFPDLDLAHPWDIAPERAIELARACESAALAVDKRVTNSEGAMLASHRGLRVFGNSRGFLGGYPSTSHSLSCAVLASQGDEMQRDYWYTAARDWKTLEPADGVGRASAIRAVERLGSRKIPTCKAPVLYAPELARGLIRSFVGAVSGGSQYRKSTFLLDAAGRTVLPKFVRLRERPHIPGALGSSPFDSEGVTTRDRSLVEDGVLQGYVLDSYSARKLGLETTGNAGGIHNLVVESGPDDYDALLRRMHRGLVVTELMGQGVNLVTGDYSRGAAGFWVEDGRAGFPVHEVTIAGNLKDMLLGIVAIGNDVDLRGSIRTGSVLVDEMTIAGE